MPILADVRDESADDIRIVLEPRAKNVDPEVLMGMLFRQSDLENRFSPEHERADRRTYAQGLLAQRGAARVPRPPPDVLLRRSQPPNGARSTTVLEVLEGFLIAFLNLDRVIDIIRYDDDPKNALMREDWGQDFVRATSEKDYVSPGPGEGELSEVQVEAILNMRLRSLRRLEEMELQAERDRLMEERAGLEDLLAEEALQWAKIADELREVRTKFGAKTDGGARRTPIRRGRRDRGSAARSDDRAGTDHGRLLADGLDQGDEGSYRPVLRDEVPRRRRPALCLPCRNDGQDPDPRLPRSRSTR